MSALRIGDSAPDFSGTTQAGERIALADFAGKRAVVLYFYPRDNTSVCTAQACGFRDAYDEFAQAGAAVIGVSSDSLDKHRGFADKHRLPFPLLSDSDGSIRKAYGVPDMLGLIPQRVTFVIDKQGVIRCIFRGLFVAEPHVKEALETVKRLASA